MSEEEMYQNGASGIEAQQTKKPVVITITSTKAKGRQVRHWVILAVSDLESGVAFAPMATSVESALDLAGELIFATSWRAAGRYDISEEPKAFVLRISLDPAEDEILVPLIWRGHPVRLVTMDSPTPVEPRVVLGRYRGRMSKELRFYRGDLSDEVVL